MKFFERLHARLGDFWWYSLMLFVSCRAADLLNAFVGLWLVPRYVPPAELGAVLPLVHFSSFLALPLAVFASTFRNEISGLAIRKEFGKLKTLIRGVFIACAVFLFLALVVSRLLLPHFLARIRIVEGSLGVLILFTSFVGALAPIYGNALQALKKFRETSLINLLGAPLRLITMLIAMPFRPLAG
jgi:O-antigen/teichoic acid export membrane protein